MMPDDSKPRTILEVDGRSTSRGLAFFFAGLGGISIILAGLSEVNSSLYPLTFLGSRLLALASGELMLILGGSVIGYALCWSGKPSKPPHLKIHSGLMEDKEP